MDEIWMEMRMMMTMMMTMMEMMTEKSEEVGDKMMKKRNGGDFGNPADNHMSESEVGRCAKASGGISICQPFALSDYPERLGISFELVLYHI